MQPDEHKQKVLAKLRTARNELEDALNLSVPAVGDNPVIIPEARRKELSAMLDDLDRIVRQLEGA